MEVAFEQKLEKLPPILQHYESNQKKLITKY